VRIAILSQTYPPMVSGAALVAEKLAEHFSSQGHQVLVITASDRPGPYRSTHGNLQVERLRSLRNPFRVGQRCVLWPHRQVMGSLKDFAPDLIHTHDPLQLGLSGLQYARQHMVPVVYTIHQLPWFISATFSINLRGRQKFEKLMWTYAEWFIKKCASVTVATRMVSKEVIRNTGVIPNVISCGIDLAQFTPPGPGMDQNTELRSRLGIPAGVPIILHVGRLDRDKQVDMVVREAALAMAKTPAHLLVVGDGTEKSWLQLLSSQLGIGERSHFPGYVSNRDGLSDIYKMASVFVTTSVFETQGLVLLEAAASGLPLVAIESTCLHEVVHHGKNGYLVPASALPGTLADRLVELLTNHGKRIEMGRHSVRVVDVHRNESTFQAFEELYLSTLWHYRYFPFPKQVVRGRAAHSDESG
jgi:glycosyltransferase involved in cell wall biosynthesis